jgi:hypothetical protein
MFEVITSDVASPAITKTVALVIRIVDQTSVKLTDLNQSQSA